MKIAVLIYFFVLLFAFNRLIQYLCPDFWSFSLFQDMITKLQGQQQFEAADRIEADVLKGRWKGIVPDKLWLIECEQGIQIEIELDRYIRKLRLMGYPDATDDGLYQLILTMAEGSRCPQPARVLAATPDWQPSDDPDVLCTILIENDQIYDTCRSVLDALWNK